jgi:hypothetical protein
MWVSATYNLQLLKSEVSVLHVSFLSVTQNLRFGTVISTEMWRMKMSSFTG